MTADAARTRTGLGAVEPHYSWRQVYHALHVPVPGGSA